MSIVAWKVTEFRGTPERMEYGRETAACYFTADGRRVAKESSWEWHHESEEAAIAHIERMKAARMAREAAVRVRAAAPELLEALIAARDGANFPFSNPSLWEQVNAAIAKATGEAK